jgi:hypothetical protein
MKGTNMVIFTIFLLSALLVTSCGPAYKRNPLPAAHKNVAHIPYIPKARYWGDQLPQYIQETINELKEQIRHIDPQAKYKPFDLLFKTRGIGDLNRIYLTAKRDGIEYNLAFIPHDLQVKPKEQFDPDYMSKLFNFGYQTAKNGYPWKQSPPGFEVP